MQKKNGCGASATSSLRCACQIRSDSPHWVLQLALRTSVVLWAAVVLATACPPAEGQEKSDFTTLELKDLMALDVIAINVLGTHVHPAGQWMIGYEYLFDNMDGNRDGTRRLSHRQVLEVYNTAPTDMTMQMHMVSAMYALTNDLTLMGMLPYIQKSMNHVTRDGARFKERSEGIGDLEAHALYTLLSTKDLQHRFILNFGISLPTGSIDAKDFGPDRSMGENRLEYPMQLGSGTVDLMPGLSYLGQMERLAWGLEFHPRLRLGRNSHDYRLGNRYRWSGWGAVKLTEWLSLSGRFDAEIWGNIDGRDKTLDPTDEPTKDVSAQGGRRVDLLLGLNFYVPTGIFKGQRFAVEAGAPVYQSLNGPQLQTDWLLRVGWQWAF